MFILGFCISLYLVFLWWPRKFYEWVNLTKDGLIMYEKLFIFYSRISVTASCPMNLKKYPMDEQICTLYLRSCKLIFCLLHLQEIVEGLLHLWVNSVDSLPWASHSHFVSNLLLSRLPILSLFFSFVFLFYLSEHGSQLPGSWRDIKIRIEICIYYVTSSQYHDEIDFITVYGLLAPTFAALIPARWLGRFAPSGFALRVRIVGRFAP